MLLTWFDVPVHEDSSAMLIFQELYQLLASEAKVRVNITAMLNILGEHDLVKPLLIGNSHFKSAAFLLAFEVEALGV